MENQHLQIILLIANLVITSTTFYILSKKLSKLKDRDSDIKIVVFDEINVDEGIIKKSVKVKIKQQFYYRGIPIGPAATVSENTFESIDKDQLETLLKDYAKPLIDLGIAIVQLKSGNMLKNFKK